jgi:membrane-associated protein
MTLGGYWLGNYSFIRRNFEKVVLGIVLVSIVPLIVQVLQSRRSSGAKDSAAVSPQPVPETPE